MTCTPGSLIGTMRANFSVSHLLAAASFSRAVGKLQSDNEGRPFDDFFEDIQYNAIATVLTATAALESYANELFVDQATVFPNQPSRILEKFWEAYEFKPTLEKFDLALLLLDKGKLDRWDSPYQDVESLAKLRNALVHFKPEWTHDQRKHAKVASALKDRIERSPFFAQAVLYFLVPGQVTAQPNGP